METIALAAGAVEKRTENREQRTRRQRRCNLMREAVSAVFRGDAARGSAVSVRG
jgi:hypothetical protein